MRNLSAIFVKILDICKTKDENNITIRLGQTGLSFALADRSAPLETMFLKDVALFP